MTALTRRLRPLIVLGLLFASPALLLGQFGAARPEKAKLALAEDRTAYEPGTVARIAAVLTVEEGWHVQSHTPSFDYLIPTVLTLDLPVGFREVAIVYPPHEMWKADFEEQPLAVYQNEVHIVATVEVPIDAVDGGIEIAATLRYQACDDRQCLPPTDVSASVILFIGNDGVALHPEIFEAAASGGSASAGPLSATGMLLPTPTTSLGLMLAFAFLGGIILNAMPCVLPILSLKILGLIDQAGKGRAATSFGALATTAGIVVSFWLLAGAAVLARGAGEMVGWGIQFQNPGFVTFLAVVVLLFCLNLWGLFEIPLPRRLAAFGDGPKSGGLGGHFLTGLFATLMATPCSAPFLGSAVGFALGQSGATIFAIFTAVGVGMALPYLALAAVPRSLDWMPRPGAWMLQLKMVMGFLLAGAAVWLLYVLSAQVTAERLAMVQIGLLIIAMIVWIGQQASSKPRRQVALFATTLAVVGTIGFAAASPPAVGGFEKAERLINWEPFDRQQAEARATSENRPVFVDVTADWCFTCKANERLVLETPEIAAAFEEHQVVAMQADWTNRNDEIARLLADYGRYSIPFYLFYSPTGEALLLPELLTKSDILEALQDMRSGGGIEQEPRLADAD